MKYSDKNPPLKCFMTQSTWYKNALRNGKPVGILWHDTAAGNPYLKRYVQPDDSAPNKQYWLNLLGVNQYGNDWNHIYHGAGLNCWIGRLADGTVSTVQVGPWDTHAWGCGASYKGSCNGYVTVNGKDTWVDPFWIQFEICDDGYKDANYFKAVYEEACQITAYLCKKFGIDPNGTVSFNGVSVPTILCHQDSYRLGLGCNHLDVYSWFNKFGRTMKDVRTYVAKLMNATPAPAPTPAPTSNFKIGDIVNFTGNTHYFSADATVGKPCVGGEARIADIYKSGKHPYSLIAVPGKGSNVYGWVDTQYVKAIPKANTPSATKEVRAAYAAYNGPDKAVTGTYVTTAATSIRNGAGANYKSLVSVPAGTSVQNYGYYSLVGNTKWLYIQTTVGTVKYTGFISANYLKKK